MLRISVTVTSTITELLYIGFKKSTELLIYNIKREIFNEQLNLLLQLISRTRKCIGSQKNAKKGTKMIHQTCRPLEA